MIVEQLVPGHVEVELDPMLDALADHTDVIAPFDDRILQFCSEVSRRLVARSSSTTLSDVRALAFWMRPAHLTLLKEQFEGAQTPGTMRMPRGLVFHLPPANVDTIFMYSWLLAALGGNRSVVRLSGKRGVAVDVMCDALNDAMAEPGSRGLASSLRVVAYGHDPNVTAAISARADVRVIWGGDSTVRQIREIPLPPRSIELTFADRFSLAAVEATAYLHADPHRRSQLAEDFVSDIFPFDQAACSSPQLVAWCGPESDVAQASETFFSEVATVAGRRGYSVDAGTATAQTLGAAALAADHGVRWCRRYGRELLVVEINGPADLVRNTVGGGYLLSVRLNDLLELAPYLNRADQTLTQFGFSDAKLRDFARRAAGRGAIDRIVPVGQALAFDRYWDGYDLLDAFTRAVRVGPDTSAAATRHQPG